MSVNRYATLGWRVKMASLAILFVCYLSLIDNQSSWLTSTNHKLVVRADSSLSGPHNHLAPVNDNQQEQIIIYHQSNHNNNKDQISSHHKRQANAFTQSQSTLFNNHHDISEHDLLPFDYFFIPQPPFSDIVKTSRSNNHQVSIGRYRSSSERYEQQQRQLSLLNNNNEPAGNDNNNNNILGTQLINSNNNNILESNNINYHLALYNQYTEFMKSTGRQFDSEQEEELEYINSMRDQEEQVLYYGPQLVKEGELYEIGCFLPKDDYSEWTKSGHKVLDVPGYKTVKRDFLNTKTNYTLRVWEASLNDTGNYRCNRYSRKAHRLVVVPNRVSNNQLYQVQQQLIQMANSNNNILRQWNGNTNNNLITSNIMMNQAPMPTTMNNNLDSFSVPGILIVENKTLIWNCNISDEYVLKRLEANPHYQLAWFKNGKQILMQPLDLIKTYYNSNNNNSNNNNNNNNNRIVTTTTAAAAAAIKSSLKAKSPTSARQHQQEQHSGASTGASHSHATSNTIAGETHHPGGLVQSDNSRVYHHPPSAPRIQFRQANGRQLYIESAQYGDSGDWLCSWSKLLTTIQMSNQNEADDTDSLAVTGTSGPINPLSAGSMIQLLAPVKLRRHRASYKLKRGNDLKLKCAIERGFPPPQITWFIGNEIVDSEYLRNNEGKVQILSNNDMIQQQQQKTPTSTDVHPTITLNTDGDIYMSPDNSDSRNSDEEKKYIIDISPKPIHKLRQNTNSHARFNPSTISRKSGHSSAAPTTLGAVEGSISSTPLIQSTLVVRDLDIDKHTSRYACRAQNRVSSDEVSTMIRIQASSVVTKKPSSGKATLVPGQDLLLECEKTDDKKANFKWYRTKLSTNTSEVVEPEDEAFEIHNERLWIKKSGPASVADYQCKALKSDSNTPIDKEEATFQVRAQPFIEDFSLATSHTGKSGIITDGERLELKCEVRNTSGPVTITWLKSRILDDEETLMELEKHANPRIKIVQPDGNEYVRTLIIDSVRMEDRGFYSCRADNNVTDRSSKTIFIRVRDKLIALWPLLGIVSELAILFSIIFIWENQRANCQ